MTRNQITDFSPIKDMTELRELTIYGNEISDLNDLKNLTNLEHLYIGNTGITDISIVEKMIDLIDFDAQNNKISNIDILANLKDLETLNLSNNNISDIKSLSNLKVLKNLNLKKNKISDINVLNEMQNIDTIELEEQTINFAMNKNSTSIPSLFIDALDSTKLVYSSEGLLFENVKLDETKTNAIILDKTKDAKIVIKSGIAKDSTLTFESDNLDKEDTTNKSENGEDNKVNSNRYKGILPNTGRSTILVILIGLIIISGFLYIKNNKYKDIK